jgi:hypothetical protein
MNGFSAVNSVPTPFVLSPSKDSEWFFNSLSRFNNVRDTFESFKRFNRCALLTAVQKFKGSRVQGKKQIELKEFLIPPFRKEPLHCP